MKKYLVEVKKNGESVLLINTEGKNKVDAMFNAKEFLIKKGEKIEELKCKIYEENKIGITKK